MNRVLQHYTCITIKNPYVIAGFAHASLILFLLRNTMFHPGLIEAYDFDFPLSHADLLNRILYTWDSAISNSNVELLSLLTFYLPLLALSPSVQVFERILIFTWFFMPALIMFAVSFKFSMYLFQNVKLCLPASLVSSFLYSLNAFQWLSSLGGFSLSYSLLPAVLYLTIFIFKDEAFKDAVKKSILLSFVVSLSLAEQIDGMALVFVLLLVEVFVLVAITSRKNIKGTFSRTLLIALMGILVPFLVNAYATFPYLASGLDPSFGHAIVGGRLLITPQSLLSYSLPPLFAIIASYPVQSFGAGPVISSVIAIICYSLFFLVLLKRGLFSRVGLELIVILVALITLGVIFSSGAYMGLLGFFAWVANNIPLSWSFIHFPSLSERYVSLATSLAPSLSLPWMFKRFNRFIMPTVITLLVIMLSVSSIYPLFLTGNYMGYLSPAEVPYEYISANNFLASDSEYFRTFWYPAYGALTSLPYGHPASWYLSTVPQLNYRSAAGTSSFRSFQETILAAKQDIVNESILSALGFLSVKYIVYQGYTTFSNNNLLAKLQAEANLTLVFQEGSLWIFRNQFFQPFVRVNTSLVSIKVVTASAAEWVVRLNSSSSSAKDYMLIFSEPYDKNWKAYIGGSELQHVTVEPGPLNGYIINSENNMITVNIRYLPQQASMVGIFVSLTSLLTLAILYLFIDSVGIGRTMNKIRLTMRNSSTPSRELVHASLLTRLMQSVTAYGRLPDKKYNRLALQLVLLLMGRCSLALRAFHFATKISVEL